MSKQVHELINQIQRYSPIGRNRSAIVRNLRQDILKRLEEVTTYILPTIDLINSTGASVNQLLKCSQVTADIEV